jgi:flagellar biosynthesis protein FlhB
MADNDSSQEKTEEPTARRLDKAREDGQVARSTELSAAAVTIAGMAFFFLSGGFMVSRLAELFAGGFKFDARVVRSPEILPMRFAEMWVDSMLLVVPLFIITVVVAVLSSGMTGGYLFSAKALMPKASKMSPIEGFKRMFGPRAAIELLKAVLKFSLVSAVLIINVNVNLADLTALGSMAMEPALAKSGAMIAQAALYVALSLAIIAAIDVPYQKHSFMKRMRMTKQEIKDEMKDVEGRPEVKAQIRRRQREMSNARMMTKIKDADVVITNPEHFAVALSYDPTGSGAPLLVAKGVDYLAARIREEAKTHDVYVFAAPPLARALYYTTELDQPIPEDLYVAVAQVIAYVYNLSSVRPGDEVATKPAPKVPPNMRYDAQGKPEQRTA